MARRTTHRRVTEARRIAAGAVGLAAYVAERFAARQRAFPGLEDVPDFAAIQVEAARWLGAAADRLEAADRAFERQKVETRRARRERDLAAKTLYRRLVAVRKALSGPYPSTVVVRLLGLEGKTPREPWPLLHAGREAVWRLRDGAIDLPEPKTAGFSLDRLELAAGLEELVDDLDSKLDAVLDAQAGETVCLVRRDEMLAEFREVRTGAARLLEGIYLAAGLRHLVPGIRHPGATASRASRPTAELETTPPHRSPATSETLGTRAGASGERSEALGSRSGASSSRALHETTSPHRFGKRSARLGRRPGGFLTGSERLRARAGGFGTGSGRLGTRPGGFLEGPGRLGKRPAGWVGDPSGCGPVREAMDGAPSRLDGSPEPSFLPPQP